MTHLQQEKNFTIRSYFDLSENLSSKDEVLKDLVSQVEDSPVGFAGFIEKKYLQDTLSWLVFDTERAVEKNDFYTLTSMDVKSSERDVLKILESSALLVPPKEHVYIHIFPTWNSFVKSDMDSVSGFTPYKNTLLLFIGSEIVNKNVLTQTVAHEYLHTQHYNYKDLRTLRDALVFEGLAEHFSETISGEKSKFTKSLGSKEIQELYIALGPHLESTEISMQREVFTLGEKYPLWGGYALGYVLVDEYKKNNPSTSWVDFLEIDSVEVVK